MKHVRLQHASHTPLKRSSKLVFIGFSGIFHASFDAQNQERIYRNLWDLICGKVARLNLMDSLAGKSAKGTSLGGIWLVQVSLTRSHESHVRHVLRLQIFWHANLKGWLCCLLFLFSWRPFSLLCLFCSVRVASLFSCMFFLWTVLPFMSFVFCKRLDLLYFPLIIFKNALKNSAGATWGLKIVLFLCINRRVVISPVRSLFD